MNFVVMIYCAALRVVCEKKLRCHSGSVWSTDCFCTSFEFDESPP